MPFSANIRDIGLLLWATRAPTACAVAFMPLGIITDMGRSSVNSASYMIVLACMLGDAFCVRLPFLIIPCRAVVSDPDNVVGIAMIGSANSSATALANPTALPPPYEIRQSAFKSCAAWRPSSTTSHGVKGSARAHTPAHKSFNLVYNSLTTLLLPGEQHSSALLTPRFSISAGSVAILCGPSTTRVGNPMKSKGSIV